MYDKLSNFKNLSVNFDIYTYQTWKDCITDTFVMNCQNNFWNFLSVFIQSLFFFSLWFVIKKKSVRNTQITEHTPLYFLECIHILFILQEFEIVCLWLFPCVAFRWKYIFHQSWRTSVFFCSMIFVRLWIKWNTLLNTANSFL